MEGMGESIEFAAFAARGLGSEMFVLIDVGCSGGINPNWRAFGESLIAHGFDPNISECRRLTELETLPGVVYIPAFVGLPDAHPVLAKKKGRDYWSHNPWARLSVARTLEIDKKQRASLSETEKRDLNLWKEVELADFKDRIFLPKYFEKGEIRDIDFVKVDVDGPDYDILQSIADDLEQMSILGVGIEVNFFGSDNGSDHTFHNVDRFMREHGFELFDLSIRKYSLRSLPAQYVNEFPGRTIFGRPLQGDALYVRDLCAPEWNEYAASCSVPKLLKLSAIFSLFGLPDCAAEVLQDFRTRLSTCIDIDAGLNLLAEQAQLGSNEILGYEDYLAEFEADSTRFYPRPTKKRRTDGTPLKRLVRKLRLWR